MAVFAALKTRDGEGAEAAMRIYTRARTVLHELAQARQTRLVV
jgi:hypothetical protein